ncbi:MAG: hypothetical protein IJ079_06745 [Lachnospiraceae bacterium]|nr:hypothetical protein [Lachnospiraceae bacterium]
MLKNKKKNMIPFDMKEPPIRQNPILTGLLWAASWLVTRKFRLKIRKDLHGIKPPYLVLSTHQGFSDYYLVPLALFPFRANYVSDMEGFAAYGKWLYRAGGCIGKRRYVPDLSVIYNIKYSLFTLHQSVVLFPESRHSNVGTTSQIPDNMGRLVKYLGVPLVILRAQGSYLANPFWDEEHTRKTRMEVSLDGIYTADDVRRLTAEEIQKTIEENLRYDEYEWQLQNEIVIDAPKRAEGLHKPLYQCIACKTQGRMVSRGALLCCKQCGSSWKMDSYGRLIGSDGNYYHIPDWYEWERQQVIWEIQDGSYVLDIPVRIEALPNEKGFVELGTGKLTHDSEKYVLSFDFADEGVELSSPLVWYNRNLESTQTEYNYRGKGKCIVLSTQDCCYYIYSDEPEFCVTKLMFAVEAVYTAVKKGESIMNDKKGDQTV